MKRLTLILLFVLLAVSLALAGPGTFIPNNDVLGAHNNGGRGCAACHAPHSGGAGGGGNTVSGAGIQPVAAGAQGDYHLWGTDLSIITQETLQVGGGFNTGGAGFTVNFGGAQQWTPTSLPVVASIASCLSCHDGNVSKGAMMMNQSYEQAWSLLPGGHGQHTTNGPLYGTAPIPTLLGNEGTTGANPGDYLNDHPVGPNANLNGLDYPKTLDQYGLTYTTNCTSAYTPITWTVTGQYASFVANYGMPGIKAMTIDCTNLVPYVTCTTCHNQHQMNVFAASASNTIAGSATGTYATYFFVNAPYNPGAAWTPTAAPSTTQFCRQCHFGTANEAFGVNTVVTAF